VFFGMEVTAQRVSWWRPPATADAVSAVFRAT
jgi:hypothetical protein